MVLLYKHRANLLPFFPANSEMTSVKSISLCLSTCITDSEENPPGGGQLREVWVGVCRRGLQTLTLFKTKSVHFATLFKKETFIFSLCSAFFFCLLCFPFPIQKVFFYYK